MKFETEARQLKDTLDASHLPPPIKRLQIKTRGTLRGHLAKVYDLAWASDSRTIITVSQDGKLIFWDTYVKLKQNVLTLNSSWVMCCGISNDMSTVATGGLDNSLTIYSAKDLFPIQSELRGHDGYVSSCNYLDGNRIVTSSGDATCVLWDVTTSRPIIKLRGHRADVARIATASDTDNYVLSGACDSTVKLWDVRTGTAPLTFECPDYDICWVTFHPSNMACGAACAASDEAVPDSNCIPGKIRMYDFRTSNDILENDYGHYVLGYQATCCDFSRSGRLIILAGDYGKVKVIDSLYPDSNEVLKDFPAGEITNQDQMRISSLGVSPDGTMFATASWDTVLRLYHNKI